MSYDPLDFTEPNVCVDENITTDDGGMLKLQPWSVPRLVGDVRCVSGGDGKLTAQTALPGKLLIDQKLGWKNDCPLSVMMLVRVIRGSKNWEVSNPNAIQFRDRWTYIWDADDLTPSIPYTSGIYNSQCGSSIDLGTNSVAEPMPGVQWCWVDSNISDEWVGPVDPADIFNLWYRCYVWTPPPWSDNANKNQPVHIANAGFVRIQLWAFPTQGTLVTG